MKKITFFIIFATITNTIFAQNLFKFRNLEWFSSYNSVTNSEGNPDEVIKHDNYGLPPDLYDSIEVNYFEKNVAGYKAFLQYWFANDKFFEARYRLNDIYLYNVSSVFSDLHDKLVNLYGNVDNDIELRKIQYNKKFPNNQITPMYNINSDVISKLIEAKKMITDSYVWKYNNTVIKLEVSYLYGGNGTFVIYILYTPNNYMDAINESIRLKKNQMGGL